MHLRELGFSLAQPLMRTEAARLIRELRRHPGRFVAAPASRPATAPVPRPAPAPVPQPVAGPVRSAPRQAPPPPPPVRPADLSQSTKTHAYHLRAAFEEARRKLATNPNGPNVRADVAGTTVTRQEFWLDTCREVKEMHIGSVQVLELYQAFGCRFFSPNHEQVQEILDALDSARHFWDRDNPEFFYQTLELNFPNLVRRG